MASVWTSNALRMRRRGPAQALAALSAALACAAGGAAEPAASALLGDGPGGMTCQYYDAQALLAWNRPGGDWVDAQGRAYGASAFAQADIGPLPAPQWVEWDLRTLAQAWNSGAAVRGVVALRPVAPLRGGALDLASRENPDRSLAPVLALKWSDGQTQRLPASADTFFACPTYASQGQLPLLSVMEGRMAVLAFAYEPRPGQTLTSARLLLSSTRQYARGAVVGAFGMRLPTAADEPDAGPGLAKAVPQDRGLAGQPGVLYAQDFESSPAALFYAQDPSTRSSLRIVGEGDDSGLGFKPLAGKALAVTIRRGTQTALNQHLRLAGLPGGEPDAAYFRYYLRLSDNWNPRIDGGKMPGLAGTYGRAGWGGRSVDGRNGWSARGGFMKQVPGADGRDDNLRALVTYAYLPTTEGAYGEIWGWNLGPTGRVPKNRWVSVEQYVKLNQPGQSDGEYKAWIDGRLVAVRKSLRWRDVPELRIESVWLNVFHGGTSTADRDLTLYIDNLVIARDYIGPGNFPDR